jgi:hypothetical protein
VTIIKFVASKIFGIEANNFLHRSGCLNEERVTEINAFHQSTTYEFKEFPCTLSENGNIHDCGFCDTKTLLKTHVFWRITFCRWVNT